MRFLEELWQAFKDLLAVPILLGVGFYLLFLGVLELGRAICHC